MKRLVRIIGIMALLVILIALALPFLVNANAFRPRLEAALTEALGRKVTVGDLKLALLSGSVTANDLSIADDPAFSSSPFLHAKALKLTVELWPLITSQKLNITGLTIETPEIALLQSPAGTWNYSGLGAKSGAASAPVNRMTTTTTNQASQSSGSGLDLSAKLVRVTGGRISIGQTQSQAKPQVLENVNIEVQNFSPAAQFPFSLTSKIASGGDISLQGKAGPINSANAASTPVAVNLKVTGLNLGASGFVDAGSGIDGLVAIDGTGSSNGNILQWKGVVRADRAKFARGGTPARKPVAFDFAIQHDLQKHSGVLSRGQIHIGNASANLGGTYVQRGDSTTLNMRLLGSAMPVPELAEMLPPLDIVLPSGSSLQGGTANVDVAFAGPTSALVSQGSLALNNTTLAGFDLGGKLATIEKLGGFKGSPNTQIETFSTNFRAAPQGMDFQQIKLIVPTLGVIDGTGTVTSNHTLDFKMRAAVHSSAVLAAIGQRGDTVVPFFVQGTAANPVFTPDVKGIAASEIERLSKGKMGKSATDILGGFLGGKKK